MIETALYFALGFLTAGLLALMVMPAIWRRAVRLTRRRLEASTPLSRAELLADRDRLAASFAMSTRRLEMIASELRRKSADHMAEAGRQRDAAFAAQDERDAARAEVEGLKERERALLAEIDARDAELASHGGTIAKAAEDLAGRDTTLAEREARIGALLGQLEDKNLEISTQITRIAGAEHQLADLRKELATTRERLIEAESALAQRQTSLALEKDRAAQLERKVADLETELRTTSADLDRNIRNLARATEAIAEADARIKSLDAQLAAAPRGVGDNTAPAIEALERQRQELETRLAATGAERDRLVAELDDLRRWQEAPLAQERAENATLRERLGDLAAEVVKLTRALEGDRSEVARMIAEAPAQPTAGARRSLIERIRALQSGNGREPEEDRETTIVQPARATERV